MSSCVSLRGGRTRIYDHPISTFFYLVMFDVYYIDFHFSRYLFSFHPVSFVSTVSYSLSLARPMTTKLRTLPYPTQFLRRVSSTVDSSLDVLHLFPLYVHWPLLSVILHVYEFPSSYDSYRLSVLQDLHTDLVSLTPSQDLFLGYPSSTYRIADTISSIYLRFQLYRFGKSMI